MFPEGVAVDGDDPAHVQWIFEKAKERAHSFNIQGVTYRLTQGNIIFINDHYLVVPLILLHATELCLTLGFWVHCIVYSGASIVIVSSLF